MDPYVRAEAEKCRRLACAVIIQAARDVVNDCNSSSPYDYNKWYAAHNEACAWFSSGGPDFRQVCDMAGVCARSLRQMFFDNKLDVLTTVNVHAERVSS